MFVRFRSSQNTILTSLIGAFFILILHFKLSYSLIPILLAVFGLVLIFPHLKKRDWQLSGQDKWLIGAFSVYFVLFVVSLIVHKGKGSELDLPSRALLALPILAVLAKQKIKQQWVIYGLVLASLVAGVVALIQVFGLGIDKPFPRHMWIQSGDIAMSLAMFTLATLFYFYHRMQKIWLVLSFLAVLFGLVGSLLTTARGAWVALPAGIITIFWFNRKKISKWIAGGLILMVIIAGVTTQDIIKARYNHAAQDIKAYIEANNGYTSVGARFDMWKSAWLGIQEKPLFGWGLQGVKEMRKQHVQEGKVAEVVATFDHAHNQYLHDGSARGMLGLLALLGIFFVPLALFWQNLKGAVIGSRQHLWGVLGISHILMTMAYCLTQGFLSHTSGAMFYFVPLVIFYGLQKKAKTQPLVNE